MSTKLPSFQFYPGDWMKDVALQGCSVAARGVWIQMLCMLHESSKRGYLQHENGKPVAVKKIARIVGCTVCETTRLLNELEESGVFSRTEEGVIYSRRVIRDEEKRETLRKNGEAGGSHGDKGGRPKRTPNETPDQTPRQSKQKPQDKPLAEPQNNPSSSSVSSSTSEVKPLSPVATDDGEQPAKPTKAKPAKDPKPKTIRPRDPLFDVIAEVTGLDPSTKSAGALIAMAASSLRNADTPYTPEDVRQFAKEFWIHCSYAAKDGRTRPSPNEIEKNIGLIRAKPAPTPTEPVSHERAAPTRPGPHAGKDRIDAPPGQYYHPDAHAPGLLVLRETPTAAAETRDADPFGASEPLPVEGGDPQRGPQVADGKSDHWF